LHPFGDSVLFKGKNGYPSKGEGDNNAGKKFHFSAFLKIPNPPIMPIEEFRDALLAWFDRHGRRDLPWQIGRTPYRVWVSEIMLQQTQVATVIPYYERFLARFPDVAALAAASPDEVIALWAGLGYYARARHLHRAARRVMEDHGGEFPADLDALAALPGVGRSTAGAILSLGLGRRAAILDGNVKRVLCRYAGLEGWPGQPSVARELWALSERLTPAARVADYNQAMMDLGALVCAQRRPDCGACPLSAGCAALKSGRTAALPAPKPRAAMPVRRCWMLVLSNAEGGFYLEKRPPVGIWGGLWSLPEFADEAELAAWCRARGIGPAGLERLPQRRHTFSHYHLDYRPVLVRAATPVQGVAENAGQGWFSKDRPGLPTPVRRLLEELASGAPESGQLAIPF
jgi:A/G-specific adenine glycosylase